MTTNAQYPQVLLSPGFLEASKVVETALADRAFVIVAGDCSVDYLGRASSKLGWGERLVIVKPDGSFLIHRNQGHDAVNWQPPGSKIFIANSNECVLKAFRSSPAERLEVTWRKILLVAALLMKDDARFEMHLTEEDLYRVILSHPELIEEGLKISSLQKRTAEGVPDFTGYDSAGKFVVVEVKKDRATANDVKQLYKYLYPIRSSAGSCRGLLAAPGINSQARRLVSSLGLEFVRVDLKRCAEITLAGRTVNQVSTLDVHVA